MALLDNSHRLMFHVLMLLLRRRFWVLGGAVGLAHSACISRGDTTVNAGFVMAGSESTGGSSSSSSSGGKSSSHGGSTPTAGTGIDSAGSPDAAAGAGATGG